MLKPTDNQIHRSWHFTPFKRDWSYALVASTECHEGRRGSKEPSWPTVWPWKAKNFQHWTGQYKSVKNYINALYYSQKLAAMGVCVCVCWLRKYQWEFPSQLKSSQCRFGVIMKANSECWWASAEIRMLDCWMCRRECIVVKVGSVFTTEERTPALCPDPAGLSS